MSAFASWLLAFVWITLLAVVELALVWIAWCVWLHFHVDDVRGAASYVRSFFDDPVANNKGSMARWGGWLCLALAAVVVGATLRLAFLPGDHVASLHSFEVALGTLLGTGAIGLLLRKKADGSTEPDDDRGSAAASGDVHVEADVHTGPPA